MTRQKLLQRLQLLVDEFCAEPDEGEVSADEALRLACIAWLDWNDSDGVYNDADTAAEALPALSPIAALSLALAQYDVDHKSPQARDLADERDKRRVEYNARRDAERHNVTLARASRATMQRLVERTEQNVELRHRLATVDTRSRAMQRGVDEAVRLIDGLALPLETSPTDLDAIAKIGIGLRYLSRAFSQSHSDAHAGAAVEGIGRRQRAAIAAEVVEVVPVDIETTTSKRCPTATFERAGVDSYADDHGPHDSIRGRGIYRE